MMKLSRVPTIERDIGFFPSLVPRTEETQRMIFRDNTPALRSGVERDAAEFDELFEFRPSRPTRKRRCR